MLFVNSFSSSTAQQQNIPFKRLSIRTLNFEQGLLNNSTTNIITDANGFTWISTFTGMQRYNGYTLEQINPIVNNKIIQINSSVYFFALRNGKIWISYNEGVLEYSPNTNSFKRVAGMNFRTKSSFSIIPLTETDEGIWCLQENKGIIIYKPENGVSKLIYDSSLVPVNLLIYSTDILYKTLVTTNDKFIFIQTSSKSILRINKTDHSSTFIAFNQGIIFNMTCSNDKLYLISNNSLAILNISDGLVIKTISIINFINGKLNAGVIMLNKDQLLVSMNSHLFEFDTLLNNQKEYATLSRNPVVSTGVIQLVYPDKFKRIWLLTNDDIKRIENVNVPFDHFIYPDEHNNFVRSLYYDEQKHLLIAGCYNGSIELFDTLANPVWKKPLMYPPAGYILSIEKLSGNEYLLLTFGNGLFILNLQKKDIKPFILPDQPGLKQKFSATSFANSIQRLNDSTLFICTTKNIFRCVFKKSNLVAAIPILAHEIAEDDITCFIYTAEKLFWLGTASGNIYKINSNGSVQTVHIPGNYAVRCFAETLDHKIWTGTNKGLYIYDEKTNLRSSVSRETGLLNDCIYAMLAFDSGSVYASSNLGLSYINEDGHIKNFSKELGLQDNEFNTGSATKSWSKKFYFGGVNGISAFYPGDLSKTKDTPVLNITRFVVNDSIITSSTSIWKGDTISLKYSQNHLEFDLAALGLLNNSDYVYTYRLKGFEEKWQNTHQPTGIKYNLEPGTYTLEMLSSPSLSSNNIVRKNLIIIIHPPWWRTWWFITLAFLIALGGVFLIVHLYNRRKYVNKIADLKLQQQIQDERERISRDLHDNIGAKLSYISSSIDWMIDAPYNKDEENKRMISINETAKNVMHNLRETIWALNRESIYIDELSDKLKLFIQQQLHLNNKITKSVNENFKDIVKLTPNEALNIYRICQEAINNAIKHSGGSEIIIEIETYSLANFSISIRDNGKGFNTKEYPGHYGLINMKHRGTEAGVLLTFENSNGTKVTISK